MSKEKAQKVEVEEAAPVARDSEARLKFKNLIEVYKKKNPAKYAAKAAELAKKLAAIA